MRIIDDDTYARIIKIMLQDDKVALFQKLLLLPKTEENSNEKKESEE